MLMVETIQEYEEQGLIFRTQILISLMNLELSCSDQKKEVECAPEKEPAYQG